MTLKQEEHWQRIRADRREKIATVLAENDEYRMFAIEAGSIEKARPVEVIAPATKPKWLRRAAIWVSSRRKRWTPFSWLSNMAPFAKKQNQQRMAFEK